MKHIYTTFAMVLVAACLFVGCKPKTPKELVLGTWMVKGDNDTTHKERVTFNKDSIITETLTQNDQLGRREAAGYRVSDDGKLLVVIPSDMVKDSVTLKIVLLNDTTLRMLLPTENTSDTVVFIRKK